MRIIRNTHNKYSRKGNKKFHFLRYGTFGIKTISCGRITEEKWKNLDRTLRRKFKIILGSKKIKIWSPVEFNCSLTKLSPESRMGKGKGSIYAKSKFLKSGTLLFECSRLSKQYRKEVLYFVQKRLSLKLIITYL